MHISGILVRGRSCCQRNRFSTGGSAPPNNGKGRSAAASLLAAAVVAVALAAVSPSAAGAQQDVFSDVTEGVYKPAIDSLAGKGVFEGTLCGDGMFCPGEPIKRSDMAVWLIRALADEQLPAAGASRFADVGADEWWAPYAERLADLDITKGCKSEPLRFCPEQQVSRGQMASFLVRAFDLEPADPRGFIDTAGSVHEAAIDALAAAGVTAGCRADPLSYCPQRPVTRAQMATFLSRALDRISAIAVGSNHWCLLRGIGAVECWGLNDEGQTDAPDGTFSAFAAGGHHTCGLRTDGTVACWGSNYYGQADAPDGMFTAVAAGIFHSCGLRTDGTVTCWGDDENGQGNVHHGRFTAVAAGSAHACGLRPTGFLACWGARFRGRTVDPVRQYPLRESFTAVTLGAFHGCGLRADGTAACWGGGGLRGVPGKPRGTFTQLSAGPTHTCGLRADGAVACWGLGLFGETDPPEGSFVAISSGGGDWRAPRGITCAVHSDRIHIQCWGEFESGDFPPRGPLDLR